MQCRLPLLAALLASIMITTPLAAQTWPSNAATPPSLAGFGGALLIDGDTIIASRTGESTMFPEPPTQMAGVHVFTRDGNGWVEQFLLEASDGTLGDKFGDAMALSGNTLVIAAPNADDGRGAVYLFTRNGTSGWQETARLAALDGKAGDHLGAALAIQDDVLLVGAPGHAEGKGSVYVFKQATDGWMEHTRLAGSQTDAGHQFGAGLAFSGTQALVGTPGYSMNQGGTYAFRYDPAGDAWAEQALLAPSDTTHTLFGLEMTLAGDLAVIAAPGMSVRGNMMGLSQPKSGTAYVFQRDAASGRWTQEATLSMEAAPSNATSGPSPALGFGSAVALNGNEAWIGAPFANGFTGAVYVYARDDAMAWSQSQVLTTRPLSQGAGFGTRLAARDDLAAITVYRSDFGDGRALVYERDADGAWAAQATIADAGLGLTSVVGEAVDCEDGEAGPFACSQVDLLSFLPVGDVGGARGVIVNDIWGWTDPETGHEIVVVGRSDGTSFVDITDPNQPVFLGDLPLTEGATPNAWRDVKVYADHAFVVADNVGKHGMQVFDLTQLRGVTNPPVTFEATAVYDQIYSAHNVVINEDTGFAYIVAASGGGETCGGGYHLVDVRDPKNPQFAGCYNDPSAGAGATHVHDAQCVVYHGPDDTYQGKEVCFGSNATVLSITDVSDKDNPKTLAAVGYPNVAYVHQGWLTEDHHYFYLDDEGDEVSGVVDGTRTIIWDVSDLEDPVVVKEFIGTTQASDHNLYVKGNLMYQSNYVSGLRILDISDPANPREVGYFDTVPSGANAPGFAGSWSNYPFFESGTIVVSSIREGLFMLKKRDAVVP